MIVLMLMNVTNINLYYSDDSTRYSNAARRAMVRTVCFSGDALLLVSLVLKEHDPTATCPRRHKGQYNCPELTCFQCDIGSVNLVSTSGSATVGAITHLATTKLPMHDRQFVLSKMHGACEPRDVDWESMDNFPTGTYN